ncbi:general odorant-binding protein 19d-like [Epargyreus clarus]|uniref:general odorant-binding protein 19d-like n=1 Tax=Epargyreus clarus TaxID=520877 RepID=UPI003C2C11D7
MALLQLFLCSCFVGVTLARTEAEIKTWFFEQAVLCAKDFPITEKEMLQLQKHVIPDSKNAKCLLACVFQKTEWMDDKGMFIEENAVKLSEQEHPDEPDKVEKGKKLFDMCKKVNDETISVPDSHCERAAMLTKCLTENAPKMGFKIE